MRESSLDFSQISFAMDRRLFSFSFADLRIAFDLYSTLHSTLVCPDEGGVRHRKLDLYMYNKDRLRS